MYTDRIAECQNVTNTIMFLNENAHDFNQHGGEEQRFTCMSGIQVPYTGVNWFMDGSTVAVTVPSLTFNQIPHIDFLTWMLQNA